MCVLKEYQEGKPCTLLRKTKTKPRKREEKKRKNFDNLFGNLDLIPMFTFRHCAH